MLKEWTQCSGSLQAETANKMQEWFESGLQIMGTSLVMHHTLASRSQAKRQVLLYVAARCTNRLHGLIQEPM
ncbi:hypothetical protein OK016_03190 [Vibrio chagasii]|nr:hypothetical protein [Vibrio chagasii]